MWQRVLRQRTGAFFTLCCLWIAVVSAHDAVLVVVHHQVIELDEQNPLGRWLIQRHDGEVWLFVGLKFAGAAAVCTVLVMLYQSRVLLATTMAAAVAGFQFTDRPLHRGRLRGSLGSRVARPRKRRRTPWTRKRTGPRAAPSPRPMDRPSGVLA
jgi:hypothetical protein